MLQLLRLLLVPLGTSVARRAAREFIGVMAVSLQRSPRQPRGDLALDLDEAMIPPKLFLGRLPDRGHGLCYNISGAVTRPVARVSTISNSSVPSSVGVGVYEPDELVVAAAADIVEAPPDEAPDLGVDAVRAETPGPPMGDGVNCNPAVGHYRHGASP